MRAARLLKQADVIVYDELGAQNLHEGLALLQSSTARAAGGVTTAEDLHREWRRAKTRAADAEHMRRMGLHQEILQHLHM